MTITVSHIQFKDELNQDIWDGDRLRPLVRHQLLLIVEDFLSSLGVDEYEDVQFTGSLANFNWSTKSDIDLHPIIDFSKIDENIELVRDFFLAKKSLWNDEHDIEIHGFEVECYAQHVADPHHSTGVYSVLNDKWIVKPSPVKPDIDLQAVKQKATELKKIIDKAIDEFDSACLDKIKVKLKKMRQCGLEVGGEFSIENLAYKVLRNNGVINKLYQAATEKRDQELSITS